MNKTHRHRRRLKVGLVIVKHSLKWIDYSRPGETRPYVFTPTWRLQRRRRRVQYRRLIRPRWPRRRPRRTFRINLYRLNEPTTTMLPIGSIKCPCRITPTGSTTLFFVNTQKPVIIIQFYHLISFKYMSLTRFLKRTYK